MINVELALVALDGSHKRLFWVRPTWDQQSMGTGLGDNTCSACGGVSKSASVLTSWPTTQIPILCAIINEGVFRVDSSTDHTGITLRLFLTLLTPPYLLVFTFLLNATLMYDRLNRIIIFNYFDSHLRLFWCNSGKFFLLRFCRFAVKVIELHCFLSNLY